MKTFQRLAVLGAVLGASTFMFAGAASAHPGHGGHSLAEGLAHPVSGLDHVLAMTAVGLLAARRGGKAVVAWPAMFMAAMLGGYGLGVMDPGSVPVEPAVLASVIILGLLAASSRDLPAFAGAVLIGVFGLCHGYAHGAEGPAGGSLAFAVGFAITTAALHGLGLGLGVVFKGRLRAVTRATGAAIALGGLALVLAGGA